MESILINHGVQTCTIKGVLYALDVYSQYGYYFDEWVSTSSWNRNDLFAWLGY